MVSALDTLGHFICWGSALAGALLVFLGNKFTLIAPLPIQVYKWVLVNLMVGLTLLLSSISYSLFSPDVIDILNCKIAEPLSF